MFPITQTSSILLSSALHVVVVVIVIVVVVVVVVGVVAVVKRSMPHERAWCNERKSGPYLAELCCFVLRIFTQHLVC